VPVSRMTSPSTSLRSDILAGFRGARPKLRGRVADNTQICLAVSGLSGHWSWLVTQPIAIELSSLYSLPAVSGDSCSPTASFVSESRPIVTPGLDGA
jgi:hypothetical protein